MDQIKAEILNVTLYDIPEEYSVLISKDDLKVEASKRFYQLGLKKDIQDNKEDILVYDVDFDETRGTIQLFDKPNGYNQSITKIIPPLLNKNKENLIQIIE